MPFPASSWQAGHGRALDELARRLVGPLASADEGETAGDAQRLLVDRRRVGVSDADLHNVGARALRFGGRPGDGAAGRVSDHARRAETSAKVSAFAGTSASVAVALLV